jgi:RecB family exonuclease
MSFSALSRYEECPRSYYLGKVKNAEEKQTWFFPIGSAVHNMIEAVIPGMIKGKDTITPKAEDFFYPLIEKQMKIDPEDVNWLAGGPKDDPVFRDKALDLVKRCFENALAFLEDIDVWEVEYDATGMLPGCEVPIKGFIDIVGEHKKHGPVIVDWKSGKQKPKTALQLETYHALLMENDSPGNYQHVGDFVGLWAMLNPDAAKARPVEFKEEPSALGARYQKAYEDIKGRKWKANHGFHCRFCTQSPNCLIEAGPTQRALYYDKSEEEGYPF